MRFLLKVTIFFQISMKNLAYLEEKYYFCVVKTFLYGIYDIARATNLRSSQG